MPIVLWVALGSAVGGAARYGVGVLLQRHLASAFPIGTLAINLSGSFLLGLLLRYSLATPAISAEVRALLTAGVCGGYTTFSTFSYETATLIEDGDYHRAAWYVALSVLSALGGTFLGFGVARQVLDLRRRLQP